MFDDVADFTSFGVATSMLIFKCIKVDLQLPTFISAVVASCYLVAIGFRLVRFVVNKRKAGIKTGVAIFEGFPSPAGSAFMITITSLLEVYDEKRTWVHIVYLIALGFICFITVSTVPYPHMGRTIAKFMSKKVKGIYGAYFFLCMITAVVYHQFKPILALIFISVSLYLISPLFNHKIDLYGTKKKTDPMEESGSTDINTTYVQEK